MKKVLLALCVFASVSAVFAQNVKQDALVLYNNGRYAESVAVCEQELLSNPNRIESYVVMCWALVRNKQYSEAEQRATDGLKISPYDLRLIEILGEAKYYLGKNNGAMEQFQRYVASAPESGSRVGTAYYFMGEIFIRQGKFNHADIAFSQAVKTEPLNDAWWTRLGYVREMTKNYKLSVVAYEKAISLNNLNTEAKRGKERVMKNIR